MEDYEQLVFGYLAGLRGNGQVVGEDWNLARVEDRYEFACIVPEADSLKPVHHDECAATAYERLLAGSSRPPETTPVGAIVEADEACSCQSPAAHVLFTTLVRVEPPVLCSDCGAYVPLYRLPRRKERKLYYRDYDEISEWESVYRACDTLYMDSGLGERFGWRQMRDPKSKLTQLGLAACSEMSARTGKPFYYFLITSSNRLVKRCPSCGADWRAEQSLAGRFDLVCENCRFVSIGAGA